MLDLPKLSPEVEFSIASKPKQIKGCNKIRPAQSLVILLIAACTGDPEPPGNTGETPPVSVPEEGVQDEAAAPAAPRVIELQSSGSLGFKVVAGPIDDGWCALLVSEEDGADAWSAAGCTVSTATAAAEGISYAIESAPASPDVQVLYGLVEMDIGKIAVDLESGSTTATLEAGPAPRSELGDFGSFSLFLRPGAGNPVRIRLIDQSGAEVRTIDL